MHPCGLHFVYGKKGGGKSMYAVRSMIGILTQTARHVITNLPLNFGELKGYISERYPNFSDDLRSRITIVEEVKYLKRFWLIRGAGWTIPDVPKDEFNKGRRLDYRLAYRWPLTSNSVKRRLMIEDMSLDEIKACTDSDSPTLEVIPIPELPACQYIIDEIQNVFPARGFMNTSPGALFWLSQLRHLGDDAIVICQNISTVDKEFRDLGDDWLYIVNWGRKQKSWFRLPRVMTWEKYDAQPGPGVHAMLHGFQKIDVEGVGKCYDTSAGVGIEGGLVADTKEKTPGIHWSFAVLVFATILVSLFFLPKAVMAGVKGLFGFYKPSVPISVTTGTNSASVIGTNDNLSLIDSLITKLKNESKSTNDHQTKAEQEEDQPYLTGIAYLNNVFHFYLSDGTDFTSADPDCKRVLIGNNAKPYGCIYQGKTYRLALVKPQPLTHFRNEPAKREYPKAGIEPRQPPF